MPYEQLKTELGYDNIRDLESMLIECIYEGLIEGKLDQAQQRMEVDKTIGRDVRPNELDNLV